MRLNSELVSTAVAKSESVLLDLSRLRKKVQDGDRCSHTTPAQRERLLRRLIEDSRSEASAHRALERILEGNDLTSINYLAKGTNVARAVCRIHLNNSAGATVGFGTGFLVAPGVLMTNHHVIGSLDDARYATAEFDYELDVQGKDKPIATFEILAEPPPIFLEALDFCLVRVSSKSVDGSRSLSDFGWLPLNPEPGKSAVGEYLTIIQHPGGERKQICVRENKLLRYDPGGDTLWYQTDTVAGSSGSPAFNDSWQVVALHHSGIPKTDSKGRWLTKKGAVWEPSMDESQVAWIANEGIRISRVMSYLASNLAGNSIAQAVLARSAPSTLINDEFRTVQGSGFVDGELRVTVPLQLAVRIGDPARRNGATSSPCESPLVSVPLDSSGIERVHVDQTNYDERTGYVPNFLGAGKLLVPLPTVRDLALKRQVLSFTYKNKRDTQLRYWNYSILMHKTRRLAIYSAVNVDANERPQHAGRDGDRWYLDPRIGKEHQIGAEFYGEQSTFEVDRSKNPFDRGHLTRRLDAQWGSNQTAAKRSGDDSFHWTNCSPQHWQLNQGSKLWLGLEEYVIGTFAKETGRACVINGPLFDAPLSRPGPGGRAVLNPDGSTHPDPKFGEIAIPKFFFKVVACVGDSGRLRAGAFVVSQEDMLRTIDRLKGMPPLREERLSPAEARLLQIGFADLEKLSGLNFGPLNDTEVAMDEASRLLVPRAIESWEDIRI